MKVPRCSAPHLLLALLPALLIPAHAQEPAPSSPPTASSTGQIHLSVLVTNASGKPVPALTAGDFQLLDNNTSQPILDFQAFSPASQPDPPPQLVLVYDEVNLGIVERGFIRDGMKRFFLQNSGHLPIPVSIFVFTPSGVRAQAKPSSDGIALGGLVDKIESSAFPMVEEERMQASLRALATVVQQLATTPGRKILVWPGPGWITPLPSPSLLTQTQQRDQLREFDALVMLTNALIDARVTFYGGYLGSGFYLQDYVKGVRSPGQIDPRNLRLGALAIKTGGRGELPYVNRDSTLAEQLNNFVAENSTWYELTFSPASADKRDDYHDLKVIVNKPGLTARAATGYYAQPLASSPPAQAKLTLSADPDSAAPAAPTPITVAALEQLLKNPQSKPDTSLNRLLEEQHSTTQQGKSDADLALQLSTLELTERMSSSRLAAALASLRGAKSREALTALADASAFLSLPPAEIANEPAPDLTRQRQIISATLDYLKKTIPKLPNFYATRTTARYEGIARQRKHAPAPTAQLWHVASLSHVTVLYRNGKEEVARDSSKKKVPPEEPGLITRGTFGPILSTVVFDGAHSQFDWSHWEPAPEARSGQPSVAVFRYTVPAGKSHYSVAYRAPIAGAGNAEEDLQQPTGYHGEIAIDPATGTILRLTVQADPTMTMSITRGDILVEYGPVDIGGKPYTCPTRSVSISRAVSTQFSMAVNSEKRPDAATTLLNDVTFSNYHVFRTESEILTGADQIH